MMLLKEQHNDELPIIEIHWVDSMGQTGWQEKDYMNNCNMRMRTVGLLVSEDHESYVVSASQCLNNDHVDCPIKIPKVAVIGCWEIKIR